MQRIFSGKIHGKEIQEGSVILIKAPLKRVFGTSIGIIKWATTVKNYDVVYVTVNKPFSELINKFKESGIDTNKMFVIDAVSPRSISDSIRAENAVFIGSPKELTNISISTTSAIKKLTAAKMLIFDSLSALLFYNDFETTKEFIRYISSKMKESKITFAVICVKDTTDEKIISQLSSFVDEIIEIK